MKTWHAQWTLSRPGHDVERGSHTIKAAETEADAITAAYAHLASIGIGDGERLPSGLSLSVQPVGADAQTKPMFEVLYCFAWLPVLAMSDWLCRGVLMAAGLGFVVWGMVHFIRNGGFEAVDEGASEWLLTRSSKMEMLPLEQIQPHPEHRRCLTDAEIEQLASVLRNAEIEQLASAIKDEESIQKHPQYGYLRERYGRWEEEQP